MYYDVGTTRVEDKLLSSTLVLLLNIPTLIMH